MPPLEQVQIKCGGVKLALIIPYMYGQGQTLIQTIPYMYGQGQTKNPTDTK